MADSILKLKVESSDYDAKLKKAAEGIRHLADVAHKGGGELTGLEKAELDYIRALGEMDTKSRSASGQVRELTNTYKELKVVYNQLNEVEKADEGGKALAASLETLKQRAQEAKAQLDSASQSLQDNGQSAQQSSGFLEGLASKFTINIDAIKLFNVGLTAAKAALDVAKDAFFASESNVDEWGRTVQAAQGLYEGFLTAINNGDISGYLDRMGQIVQAARQAYNELDTLGTMKTIQTPQKSRQQTENERIRSMIQTGRYIAPMDGRRNAVFNGKEMQNGQLLTPGQIRSLERQLQNGMKTTVTLVEREVKQTGKAIDAYYNSIAKQNGMSMKEFQKGVSSWDEFSKKMQGYEDYKRWDREARAEFARQGGRGSVDFDKSNPYAEFRKWGNFRVDKIGQNSYNDLTQLIQQRDQQMAQAYSMQSQAYRTMNRAEGVTVSKLMKGDTTKSGKTGKTGKTDIQYADDSIMAQEKLISDLTQKWKTASGELRDGYLKDLENAQQKLAEMTGKVKGPDLDAMFPDMSKQNYNTGYAGSAQAKYDSARVDLALGPMNFDAINNYIGGIKSMLQDSNLGDELYTSMTEKLKDATTVSTLLQELMERGLAGADLTSTAQALKEKLLSPEGIDQSAIQSFLDELNKQIEEAGGVGLKLNTDTGEVTDDKGNGKNDGDDLKKFNEGIGKLSGGLSQVTGGLKAIGVDVPKEVDQVIGVVNGVSQIISGVGAIISIFGTTAITANTTAVGLNTAAIIGLISSIEFNTASNFIPFFANGGIVPKFADGGLIGRAAGGMLIPGNSFSGDNLRMPVVGGGMIGVNSGEVILNQAQAGVIANALEGGGMQNLQLEATIRGEDIKLALNNNSRRTGRGEYVTTRFKSTIK